MSMAVQLKNVSKTYWQPAGPPQRAITNLNLAIPGERLTGILGARGAGKTTLLRLISGYERPDQGQIFVDGSPIRSPFDADRQRIVLLTEANENLNHELTVLENLEEAARFGTLTAAEQNVYAQYLLNELHLWSHRREAAHMLTPQMQRKLAITRAIMANPYILLIDEPTVGLDAGAARTVMGWLRYLAHDHFRTVVMTTQRPQVVRDYADHVALLANGRLLDRRQIESARIPQPAYPAPILAAV